MERQLFREVKTKLHEVRRQEICGVPGVFGAAWSCDVDAMLNEPSIWSR